MERGRREATCEVLGMLWGSGSSHRCLPCAGALLAIGRFHEDCLDLGSFAICVALLLLFHHFLL